MKGGAFGQFAFHFDLASVFFNNSVNDRQPQPCPIILCRKKWIEDVGQIFGGNTLAVVAYSNTKDFTRVAVSV